VGREVGDLRRRKAANYTGVGLYLDNGDLLVVPEPTTWAMMLGGFALLLIYQRSRRRNDV
jgi:hypothetical protein